MSMFFPTRMEALWISPISAYGCGFRPSNGQKLRERNLYQTRHTFASLMLQAGEDPAWIARMMGHTTTKMLFERYGRFIQYRTRQDGSAYLEASRRA